MIYVLEGPDNCGKSLQCSNIFKAVANRGHGRPLNIHCANFGIKNPDKSETFSQMYYYKLMKDVKRWSDNDIYDVILDRSWLGEAVYGPLYRDVSGDYVFDYENDIFSKHDLESIFLITIVDDPQRAIDRDDGESFTTDYAIKQQEIQLFKEAHASSTIKNKLLIDISKDGDAQAVWRKIKHFLDL